MNGHSDRQGRFKERERSDSYMKRRKRGVRDEDDADDDDDGYERDMTAKSSR